VGEHAFQELAATELVGVFRNDFLNPARRFAPLATIRHSLEIWQVPLQLE